MACCDKLSLFIYILALIVTISRCYASNISDDAKQKVIIEEIIKHIPQKETIVYSQVPRGIILSIARIELFEENSTVLTQNGKILLNAIATLLNTFNNNCTIEVHSEESTQCTICTNTDWEYSIIRSNRIADYLSYKAGVSPQRLFPIGFGHIMPFKDNVSPKDFYNDRIDFVIFDYAANR